MAQKVAISLSTSLANRNAVVQQFAINDTPIGQDKPNKRRADVQLIQFFLFYYYKDNPQLFRTLPQTPSGRNYISIDGVCGPQTRQGIWLFQKNLSRLGSSIQVDGVVQVAKSLAGPVHNIMYTIWWLNKWFLSSDSGRGYEMNLESHPLIANLAPDLYAELKASPVTVIP